MTRRARLVSGIAMLAVAAAVALPLLAQPDPTQTPPRDGPYLMEIPAGDYVDLVFAYEGGTNGKSLRVSIESPTSRDELTVLVPPGQTVVVPVVAGNKPWRVARPLTVRLDQQASHVHGSGLTADGPVTFRPVRS